MFARCLLLYFVFVAKDAELLTSELMAQRRSRMECEIDASPQPTRSRTRNGESEAAAGSKLVTRNVKDGGWSSSGA